MVEIARAVHHNAEVIIFDEPTAALTPEEKRHFFALMHRLKARGVSIVFISHALEEALAHADRITILRDGELVVTDAAKAFDREKIVRAMVGRTLSGEIYNKKRTPRRSASPATACSRCRTSRWAPPCATTPSRSMKARSPASSA
jgi:simple sugar transport system ATP-binding protein